MEKSQNGWDASDNPDEIDIKLFPIKGTDLRIRCNKLAGVILQAFTQEFHEKVEPVEGGVFDDWSYAYRPIRGKTIGLSNHSSGCAVDLNATRHPLNRKGTFKPELVKIIKELCKKYHLRWGGSYKSRPDEMHFEVIETPYEVRLLITKLGLKETK